MTVIAVRDDGAFLRAELLLPGCSPERALAAFTSPEVLAAWWHGELTTELVPGGHYEVWFAKVPARMTGRVIRYAPASMLEFSWAWDYPADPPELAVTVQVGAAADGSATLEVAHGPHGDDADGQVARAQHREGWEYFLPQLQDVLTGPA
jgi:uncharacterized protein YndB with AHSA1/START domain